MKDLFMYAALTGVAMVIAGIVWGTLYNLYLDLVVIPRSRPRA